MTKLWIALALAAALGTAAPTGAQTMTQPAPADSMVLPTTAAPADSVSGTLQTQPLEPIPPAAAAPTPAPTAPAAPPPAQAPPAQSQPQAAKSAPAAADPFKKGNVRLALTAGWGQSFDDSYMIIGGGLSYYLRRGLDVGVDFERWFLGEPGATGAPHEAAPDALTIRRRLLPAFVHR